MAFSPEAHTAAFKVKVETTGRPVGDANGAGLSPPYYVLYPVDGGSLSGAADDPDKHRELIYQVTCVGRLAAEVRWLLGLLHTALDGQPLTVAGRYVQAIRPMQATAAVHRDEDVTPPVFFAAPRWSFVSYRST